MSRIAVRLLLVMAMLLLTTVTVAPAASAQTAGTAVTVSGAGDFAGLKVTVGQTRNLINQTVSVSWTGGAQTPPGPVKSNFLQIMQCWGDDPGPDRTQCQFGTQNGGNANVARRQLLNPHVADGADQQIPPGSQDNNVPFWAAGQTKPAALVNNRADPFLDPQISNEIPLARTRPGGTGEEFFEVQTRRQSAGLDCGAPVITAGSPVTGRSCWLVIVPRGTKEVDGSTVDQLESSPLSRSNWGNRLQVKLDFLPVEKSCTIGAAERPVRGHEPAVEAVSRWQPSLCAGGGAVFSYTQLSDDLARRQLVETTEPGLAVMTNPVPPDQVVPGHPLVYAPVALSGLAIVFNVDRVPGLGKVEPLAGSRFTEMNLTPRLVAKLLTQSYSGSIPGNDAAPNKAHLAGNPTLLTRDREFLAHNPAYENNASANAPPDMLVQLGTADTTAMLWSWVLGDAEARAFLTGTKDENGMVVNRFNQGLAAPIPTYPRDDQNCDAVTVGTAVSGAAITAKYCSLDRNPFANDMHEAARAASRGDTLGRGPTRPDDVAPDVPKFTKDARQAAGNRALLAVVDSATAARYGLPAAKLRNASGAFVAPTDESLLAGLAAMKPSGVPGVLQTDPLTPVAAAYPLTSLSYAATAPAAIDKAAGRDYAAFLRYAAGPGQQPGLAPGQLPFGYVPLPEPVRAQTLTAAATIEAQAGLVGEGVPTATEGGPDGAGGGVPVVPAAPAGTLSPAAATALSAVPVLGAVAAAATAQPLPGVTATPVADVRRTPALPAPAVGALLVALLVCGALAAALAPITQRFATRRIDSGGGGDVPGRTVARSSLSWLTARPALLERRR